MDSTKSIRLGDIGVRFNVTVKEDGIAKNISDATSVKIKFQSPSGVDTTPDDMTFTTDGSDGMVYYYAGDIFDEIGHWKFQVAVTTPSYTINTDSKTFFVADVI